MDVFKTNKVYIFILLVNLMFTFNIVAQSYLMIDFNMVSLMTIFSISIIAYFLFHLIFRKALHKILFISFIITIGLLYVFHYGIAADLYVQGSNNVASINDAVKSVSVTYYQQYKLFFICFIPLLVFTFLTFASKGLTNLILIYSMAVMILFWYLGFPQIVKGSLPMFTFIGIISFGINNCIGGLRKLKKSNPNVKINSGILYLCFLIPAIVISIITAKLPQEYKGNYIKMINGKFINAFNPVKTSSPIDGDLVKSTYNLEASGYSSNIKKLGGAININDDLVLSVKADKAEYLRGAIKDNYNGFTWSKNNEDYSLKVKEGYSVLSSKDFLSQFSYNERKMIVYPEQNKNSSIFSPIYAYNVQLDKGNVYYDDIPTFVADLSKVKTYSINYYDFPEIQAFENCSALKWLSESVSVDKGYWAQFKQKYYNYLQVPNTITQRTSDLLASISPSGQSRYYTIAKIKEYLDKNYPYTTNVSTVPENEDFIDNFLFTEKKGYCVYFATAATILCRMKGIPARYVEGFKMPESKGLDGLYKVTNKEAHAWCEVLVDPDKDLWTTLEVTPSAVSTAVTPIVPAQVVPASKLSTNPNDKVKNISENNAKIGNSINIAGYKFSKVNIVMCVFLSIIILFISKILTALAQIKKVLKGKSSIPYYKYCIKRLKQIGIVKPDNLGDLEYVETLEDTDLKAILKEVVVIAYDEFYGKKSKEYINMTNSHKNLEDYIKRNEKKSVYLLKKYLLF